MPGDNLTKLDPDVRRLIWRARKAAKRAGLCPTNDAHHPDYHKYLAVRCVSRKMHMGL